MRHLFIGFLCLVISLIGYSDNRKVTAENSRNAKCAMLTFKQAKKRAKAIFVGEVISVEKEGNKKIIEVQVEKYWKGIEDPIVKIKVSENFRYQSPYKVGETHLVYAKDDENGGLWDGRCSRSRNVEGFSPSLKEDLKKLGKAKTCIPLKKKSIGQEN